MNGIDALKAKFADVELKANARTMEEVVAAAKAAKIHTIICVNDSEVMRKTGAHFV